MGKLAFLLVFGFVPLAHADITSSEDCFHGWLSERGSTSPTGHCTTEHDPASGRVWTYIEVDYPTQKLYIHGLMKGSDGSNNWFRYEVTSCQDTTDGGTVVKGVNASGGTYTLKHTEKEAVLQDGKVHFEGEGILTYSFKKDGGGYSLDLPCKRRAK